MAREKTAKGKSPPPAGDDDLVITTMKVYRRIQRKLLKVASLADLSQPETLLRYERYIDEDLMHLLQTTTDDLRRRKSGGS